MRLAEGTRQRLRCPRTHAPLRVVGDHLESAGDPAIRYPIIDGIPILINEERSLFSIEQFEQGVETTLELHPSRVKQAINRLVPGISVNIRAEENYRKICQILPSGAKILVVGGSIKGEGMEPLYSDPRFEVVGSDVSFGPQATLICDAHDLPFEDATFDCVILQAVLEHVVEPQQCVAEVHRVLRPSGLVYAETPFMQQVHMKQYDFTRFTHLGHRRLFRHFEEESSGPVCGPGMALAWSYLYFLNSFSTSRTLSRYLTLFARLTSFFLKYFDHYLIDRPGAYDAASGFFFLGRRSTQVLSDRELVKEFRGVR